MIRKEVIEDILARTDIESLISGYVSLRRAGSNVKGLCPFHSEKSPSFTVFPANNSYYCFGCGAGGDAITFVRQIEHLDYPDAVKFLGKRAGITVIDEGNVEYQQNRVSKERVIQMNVDAAKFFHACLLGQTEDAKNALSYFTEKRRLSMSTIQHFGLGYAPNTFNALKDYMTAKGYSLEELHTADLLVKSDKGHYFDKFRNRVIFPVIDVADNVIAFGGRVMDDSKPKYLNSSDTPAFKKLRNLFALNFAHHDCGEEMVLCEGYMDVIAMHAAGFCNAVATLGTAINAEQARLMSRYTKKVIISYDSDEAGQKAATRAMKMLGEVGLDVSVLKIPGAKDPDEFIKEYGKDKFRDALKMSKTKFEYNLDTILSKFSLQIPQDRIDAVKEAVNLIATFSSASERSVYVHAVAEKTGVSEQSIKNDVEHVFLRNFRKDKKEEGRRAINVLSGVKDAVNPDYIKAPMAAKMEETVLGLLLLFKEHRKAVFEGELLAEEDFYTDFGKRVFHFLKEEYTKEDRPDSFANTVFTPEEVGRLTKYKLSRMSLTENGPDVLQDAIQRLKQEVRQKQSESANTMDALEKILAQKRSEVKEK